jgi:hypothetical protein
MKNKRSNIKQKLVLFRFLLKTQGYIFILKKLIKKIKYFHFKIKGGILKLNKFIIILFLILLFFCSLMSLNTKFQLLVNVTMLLHLNIFIGVIFFIITFFKYNLISIKGKENIKLIVIFLLHILNLAFISFDYLIVYNIILTLYIKTFINVKWSENFYNKKLIIAFYGLILVLLFLGNNNLLLSKNILNLFVVI